MDTAFDFEAVAGSERAAVLVHPHPDMGGDRRNHVIDAIFRALPSAGVSVLRFDLSTSDPAKARAETARATEFVKEARLVLVGYSFGADVALGLADSRIEAWYGVTPPLRRGSFEVVAADERPKALVVPEHDQFSPLERVRDVTASWVNTSITRLDGADHFLVGYGSTVANAVRDWIAGLE